MLSNQKNGAVRAAIYSATGWQHACTVLRLRAPLAAAGITAIQGYRDEDSSELDLDLVAESDVVVLQREIGLHPQLPLVIAAAQRHQKPIVYELDDLLFNLPDHHPDVTYFRRRRLADLLTLQAADLITTTTPTLAAELAALNSRAEIAVLPNCLPDALWLEPPAPTPEPSPNLTIGYLGSPAHLTDLEEIFPVLYALHETFPDLRVKVWGMQFVAQASALNLFDVQPGLFSNYAEFVEYFRQQQADIFIAPLADNALNRSKSHIKFLEYSAMGRPGVYADLPAYNEIVRVNDNGLLASTATEWETQLRRLLTDVNLRKQMGQRAYQTAQQWALSRQAHRWQTAYHMMLRNLPIERPFTLAMLGNALQWQGETYQENTLQREQLAHAQTLIEQQQTLIEQEQQQQALLQTQLDSITQSTVYRLMERIWELRLRLFPPGSGREALWRTLLRETKILFTQGPLVSIRRLGRPIGRAMRRRRGQVLPWEPSPELAVLLRAPLPSQLPRVAILVEPLQVHAAAQWLNNQTLAELATIWPLTPDTPATRPALQAAGYEYACVFDDRLAAFSPTWLEEHLLVHTSEPIAWTLSVGWREHELRTALTDGRLPVGYANLPVAGLTKLAAMSQPGWPGLEVATEPTVVGKLIECQTDRLLPEPPDNWADISSLTVEGAYLLTRSTSPRRKPTQHEITSHLITLPAAQPDRRPTVVVFMPFLAVGGAERITLDLLQALQRRYRFVVWTAEPLSNQFGTTADEFRDLAEGRVYTSAHFLAPHLANRFWEYLAARYQPQALYIANGSGWLYQVLPWLRRQFPKLTIINQVYDHRVGWIDQYRHKAIVRSIDVHVGVNEHIQQAFIDAGVPAPRAAIIGHSVDLDRFDSARFDHRAKLAIKQTLGVPVGKKVIAFAARMHPQKRPIDFVELARRFQDDASLTFLMSGDGPLADAVAREIGRLRLGNIRFYRGFFPGDQIIAITDVLVLPSEYEGMPVVTLEAQAMGKPVLVTDVGNNRTILGQTGGGIVVPRIGDVSALQACLKELLANPPNPDQLRAAISPIVHIDGVAEKYAAAFEYRRQAHV